MVQVCIKNQMRVTLHITASKIMRQTIMSQTLEAAKWRPFDDLVC